MRSLYLSCAFLLLISLPLSAGLYHFECITNNNEDNADIGEAQLSVEVTNGGNQVTFTFQNIGPEPSVIAEIYFDDGPLFAGSSINESLPFVDFEDVFGSVSPPDLPGGENLEPPFEATSIFSIESESPEPEWGVGPDEWVAIIYDLNPGMTVGDVEAALESGELRIGIHVVSMGEDLDSEGFVNTPEPATLVMLGLGLCMVRKRRG